MTTTRKRHIFLAGHNGMVGSAIKRQLEVRDGITLITADRNTLDLTQQGQVNEFFDEHKIDEVILAAAKVGGIYANSTYPAEFIYENLMIQANVINAAHINNINKLLFLGSSCIYPKNAQQPMREHSLLSGPLEPTNEPYAIAKIAGIKMCQSYRRQYGRDYRSIMPTNLFGPHDNFSELTGHVIGALISKMHNAKLNGNPTVDIWGTGKQRREFLFVDDFAKIALSIVSLSEKEFWHQLDNNIAHINVGTVDEVTIEECAGMIASVVGYKGNLNFDSSKPEGPIRKKVDLNLLEKLLGSVEYTNLLTGIDYTYKFFCERYVK